MPETVKRGYKPEDVVEFSPEKILLLRQVQRDVAYLINRGYDLERSVTFTANRYGLSARQRMALIRATVRQEVCRSRKAKEIIALPADQTLYIDGFNLIISLEIALSETTLIKSMDGVIRDLAGLHGTYRVIDKTLGAMALINDRLVALEVRKTVYYLDSPVSNSGRLRECILAYASHLPWETEVFLVPCADKPLFEKENVVTGDGVVLDCCASWLNLTRQILTESFPNYPYVDLSGEVSPVSHSNFYQ